MGEEEDSSEVSLCCAYCVVYVLQDHEWQVTGKGWTQVHVYEDKADHTHRIVGWTVLGFDVVINANITTQCKYKKKSEDFHKFTDQENNTYGFGFYKNKESSYEDSHKFMATIVSIIGAGAGGDEKESETTAHRMTMDLGTAAPVEESQAKAADYLQIGKLKIQQPKMAAETTSKKGISGPLSPEHKTHVKYNPKTKTFEGLPPEWAGELMRQFGVNPTTLDGEELPGYKSKIPKILLKMKDYLWTNDALTIEGLFRIAADADECISVKQRLNNQTFESCEDIHCISNLLKVWFRDLPVALLDALDIMQIADCATEDDARKLIAKLPEPSFSIFMWLVDVCVEVASYSHTNKMTSKNLGIVVGPNLFDPKKIPPSADPMASMRLTTKVAAFLDLAISARAKDKPANAPPP